MRTRLTGAIILAALAAPWLLLWTRSSPRCGSDCLTNGRHLIITFARMGARARDVSAFLSRHRLKPLDSISPLGMFQVCVGQGRDVAQVVRQINDEGEASAIQDAPLQPQ